MTFHANRLYHLLTKSFWIHLIPWLIFVVCGIMFSIYHDGKPQISLLLMLAVFTVVNCIVYLRRYPDKFTVSNGEVILWMRLKKELPDGVTINRSRWRYAKFFVTVCRVTRIEYRSNVQEKNGTIRLYGEIRTQTASGEYIDPYESVESIEICGVQDFTEAMYQLKKAFPEAERVRF